MPEFLCFEHNAVETLEFFHFLSHKLCHYASDVKTKLTKLRAIESWIDFSTLSFISPAAALVLAAEFDRARLITARKGLFTIDMHTWNSNVLSTFYELGFMPLLGIDDYEHIPESEDSPFIVPFRSGDSVDMSIASETLRSLISLAASAANLEVQSDPLKTFRNFLMVIGEALDNTIGHAYKPNIPKELRDVGRWWISGSVDPANRQLRFVVYDQGVTIPRALPYSNRFQSTQRFLRLLGIKSGAEDYAGDGAAIAAAVRVGASGTGLSFRGHGLTKMRDYIKGDRSGTLRIISRHGEYLAQTGLKDQFQARSVPLGGTLVEWTVNL